jgi:hypothetical protein
LSGELRRCGYELKPFMKTVLSSQEFFSSQARNAVIKSPVQFLVQAQKTLGVPLPSGQPLVVIYRQLGQTPFYPPNVKGWDGGKSWINTATLTYRYELARELVCGILPEQVGLPKGPSVTPTPSPTPMLNKAIAAESSIAETALKALGDDAGGVRVANAQNTRNPAQSGGTPAHTLARTPSKTPIPQVIPPPAPTPPPRLTGGLPIGRIITADDRKEPRRVVEKLSQAIFQATPETVLFEKFVQVIATNPVPFDDRTIRELAILMMSTPNYQLC